MKKKFKRDWGILGRNNKIEDYDIQIYYKNPYLIKYVYYDLLKLKQNIVSFNLD